MKRIKSGMTCIKSGMTCIKSGMTCIESWMTGVKSSRRRIRHFVTLILAACIVGLHQSFGATVRFRLGQLS